MSVKELIHSLSPEVERMTKGIKEALDGDAKFVDTPGSSGEGVSPGLRGATSLRDSVSERDSTIR